jgi:hypothetical protein
MRGRWRDFQLTRCGYSEAGLAVIRLYNETCVPHGFLPVDSFSEALHEALEIFTGEIFRGQPSEGLSEEYLNLFREMFVEAVELRNAGERTYNTPRGAKLLRILWNNY